MANGVQQPTTSEQVAAESRLSGRNRLARLVVVGSFLTLFLLVGTLLVLAQGGADSKDAATTAQNAFNAILPVLAGWVGTVLAFYFSAASQERTSVSLDKAIGQSTATTGPSTPVSQAMIALGSILKLQDLGLKKPEEIPLTELETAFKEPGPKGMIASRLVFVENSVFRHIVHISTFNAFVLKRTTGNNSTTIDKLTFADMLADPETLNQITKLVVFVPATASVGEAKTALDSVVGAQDVIVTGSGDAGAPMLGWLSNVDLIKALTAK